MVAASESPVLTANSSVIVSIIIVNWNSKQHVRNCLSSLYQHCTTANFEVIVVDGGSYDGVDAIIAREFPTVRFVQSPTNIGFGGSNNLGVRHATGSYLLLLNPDTILLEDSLTVMIQRLSTLPEAGAVGCRLLNADRSIQTSSILTFPTIINRTFGSAFILDLLKHSRHWGIAPLFSGDQRPTEVEAVSGACILIRRDIFERVGGFTESYFMYSEDVDLCYKLRLAKLRVFHVPDTSIVHWGGGSSEHAPSNFSAVMMRDSWYRFIRTHHGAFKASMFRITTFFISIVRLLLIAPLLLLGRRFVKHGTSSMRKWFAILKWSMGVGSSGRSA